jgi:2-polyprenyl-3-methyl-5-hydroxy-6-metoxy-1,4-benzoquinol methylase
VAPRHAGTDSPSPSAWLLQNADLLRAGGDVLDVAAGRGRQALWLAAAGFRVHAIDRDQAALAWLDRVARDAGWSVLTSVQDLEQRPHLAHSAYDGVLVFNYLYRPLMPAIREAVRPGGVLVYETFLVGQAERGHPKNPAFLLRPGELAELVAPLTIVRSREGEVNGNLVASIVAIRS